MKLKVFFLLLISSFSWADVSVSDNEMQIKTKNGFETNAYIYSSDSNKIKNDVVFIFLHGKSSNPLKKHYKNLYSELTNYGFKVIAPKMSWSKDWSGTLNDGIDVIDEISQYIIDNGNKAVLIGHSLGGASSLIYSANKNKKNISGIVTIAPGHMIHSAKKMRKVTSKSVERARKKTALGKGNEEFTFKEYNTGKTKDVQMRANVYLSYYDLEKFPNVKDLLEDIEIPVLWIAGNKDRLTKIYKMEDLFEWLGDNEKNSYNLLNGKHKSILENSAKTISDWSANL